MSKTNGWRKDQLAFLCLCLLWGTSALASSRGHLWSFELTANSHNLEATKNMEFKGRFGTIKLGKIFTSPHFHYGGSFDIIAGPYEGPDSENVLVDFSGTGLSGMTTYYFSNTQINEDASSLGLSLMVNYADIVGRSIGKKKISDTNANEVQNWVMRVNTFSISPMLVLSRFQNPRESGNKPSLLLTRIEAISLYIGASFALETKYKLQYDLSSTKYTQRGNLYGLTWILGISSYFGT